MASSQGRNKKREIQRGQSTLADDDRMDELYRNVLRIGRVWSLAEGEEPAAPQETVGHLLASQSKRACLSREEVLEDAITFEKLFFDVTRQIACL